MTIKEAILKSLEDLESLAASDKIYEHILKKDYYQFTKGKTPKNNYYLYYHTKNEQFIDIQNIVENIDIQNIVENNMSKPIISKKENLKYHERDLHILLSSYLNSKNIHSKTILHEVSKNNNDNHQKWIHPDMIGINFLKLQTKTTQQFVKVLNTRDIFKITSYEVKKEINTDYELKKCYFQAVSNSSWANYGYLVAFEISSSLMDEMERLNQSFGIGVVELNANPFESKILFQSKYKELDFKTIDKLSKVNVDFEKFIAHVENEVKEYCRSKNILSDMD